MGRPVAWRILRRIQAPFKRFISFDGGNAPSTSSTPLDSTDSTYISNTAPDLKKPSFDSTTTPVPSKLNSAMTPTRSDIDGPAL
jgi:hypothetical protein